MRLTLHSPIIGHFDEPEVEALVDESLWRPYMADCKLRAAVHPLVMALGDGRERARDRRLSRPARGVRFGVGGDRYTQHARHGAFQRASTCFSSPFRLPPDSGSRGYQNRFAGFGKSGVCHGFLHPAAEICLFEVQ